jgi:hypothetical protein
VFSARYERGLYVQFRSILVLKKPKHYRTLLSVSDTPQLVAHIQACGRERAGQRRLDSAGSRQAPVISSCEQCREPWISYKGGKCVYGVAERRKDAAQGRHFPSAEELQVPD